MLFRPDEIPRRSLCETIAECCAETQRRMLKILPEVQKHQPHTILYWRRPLLCCVCASHHHTISSSSGVHKNEIGWPFDVCIYCVCVGSALCLCSAGCLGFALMLCLYVAVVDCGFAMHGWIELRWIVCLCNICEASVTFLPSVNCSPNVLSHQHTIVDKT